LDRRLKSSLVIGQKVEIVQWVSRCKASLIPSGERGEGVKEVMSSMTSSVKLRASFHVSWVGKVEMASYNEQVSNGTSMWTWWVGRYRVKIPHVMIPFKFDQPPLMGLSSNISEL